MMNQKFESFINTTAEMLFRDFYGTGPDLIADQKQRYVKLTELFEESFGSGQFHGFSTSGRSEICGNHTDHNLGKILAASISMDAVAFARKNGTNTVTVISRGYEKTFSADISMTEPAPGTEDQTESIIRGVAEGLRKRGYSAGGFDAVIDSRVLPGSGLSSSACIEVLIGTIFSGLFNNNSIPMMDLGQVGQWAENVYMGKPCGLMDQLACAYGGVISVDFRDPDHPEVEKVEFNPEDHGYGAVVVDTKGSHDGLNEYYASIPEEMKKVAAFFGEQVLRPLSESTIMEHLPELRKQIGDRPVLRALHFFQENDRVDTALEAIKKKEFDTFLTCIGTSGSSSWRLLQNISKAETPDHQEMAVALGISDTVLKGAGVSRVHGGGFAGTILTFAKLNEMKRYIREMERIFGRGSVHRLQFRQTSSAMLF